MPEPFKKSKLSEPVFKRLRSALFNRPTLILLNRGVNDGIRRSPFPPFAGNYDSEEDVEYGRLALHKPRKESFKLDF
jgi:hypothetical protein